MNADQIGDALAAPIPDVPEPITAYRCWRYHAKPFNETLPLWSLNSAPWSADAIMQAICKPMGYQVDEAGKWIDCDTTPADPKDQHYAMIHGQYGCGIYGYKTFADFAKEVAPFSCKQLVAGEVELWGVVWPHERGYRAQFARPSKFYVPTVEVYGDDALDMEHVNVVRALGERYDVPVEPMPEGMRMYRPWTLQEDVNDVLAQAAHRAAQARLDALKADLAAMTPVSTTDRSIFTKLKEWIHRG